MTDNRYGDKPLGKSVEEVESEGGNRVNSSVPGEDRRELADEVNFVPAVVSGGGGTSGTPVLVNPAALIEGGSGPQDRTDPAGRGGIGWSDEDLVNRPMPDSDRGTSES